MHTIVHRRCWVWLPPFDQVAHCSDGVDAPVRLIICIRANRGACVRCCGKRRYDASDVARQAPIGTHELAHTVRFDTDDEFGGLCVWVREGTGGYRIA